MKILIVKTSSLGDIIHTLPAITDAARNINGFICDWVVEENFAEIPLWHHSVRNIIPIALRRWRKNIKQAILSKEFKKFWNLLRQEEYDYVIDAQGLIKSSLITLCSRGKTYGYDGASARESLASIFYQQKIHIPKNQHAITRIRHLFAKALNYPIPKDEADYGLHHMHKYSIGIMSLFHTPRLIFIHGCSRKNCCWSNERWIELANMAEKAGFKVQLPWGNEEEKKSAEYIASKTNHTEVLSKTTLTKLANIFAKADCAISVDTGPGHIAAALGIPIVSLYGSKYHGRTTTLSTKQIHLFAKNGDGYFPEIAVDEVWQAVITIITNYE